MAIERDIKIFPKLSASLKNNVDIILALIEKNEKVYDYLTKNMQHKREVIEKTLERDP